MLESLWVLLSNHVFKFEGISNLSLRWLIFFGPVAPSNLAKLAIFIQGAVITAVLWSLVSGIWIYGLGLVRTIVRKASYMMLLGVFWG